MLVPRGEHQDIKVANSEERDSGCHAPAQTSTLLRPILDLEAGHPREVAGKDADNKTVSLGPRFDAAYDAAFFVALALSAAHRRSTPAKELRP